MNEVVDFLGAVNTQLERSHIAYKSYIANGKIFLYAKILKRSNDELRNLLVSKAHLLPIGQSNNALALIHHLDVWTALWEDTYQLINPSLKSVFSFDNEVNFPTKEVKSLIVYYNQVALLYADTSCREII